MHFLDLFTFVINVIHHIIIKISILAKQKRKQLALYVYQKNIILTLKKKCTVYIVIGIVSTKIVWKDMLLQFVHMYINAVNVEKLLRKMDLYINVDMKSVKIVKYTLKLLPMHVI